jgi:hypothetical protein
MSAAHDAHADASAGHHDAHDHFDNEPATELGADETRTPNWVPFLGLALFFLAGVAALIGSDDDKADADKPAAEARVAAQPAAPPVKMPEVPIRPAVPVQPGQPGAGDPNPLKRLSPEQAKELQKLIEQRRQQQGGAIGQPGAPPQPGAVPQPVKPAPQPLPDH